MELGFVLDSMWKILPGSGHHRLSSFVSSTPSSAAVAASAVASAAAAAPQAADTSRPPPYEPSRPPPAVPSRRPIQPTFCHRKVRNVAMESMQ